MRCRCFLLNHVGCLAAAPQHPHGRSRLVELMGLAAVLLGPSSTGLVNEVMPNVNAEDYRRQLHHAVASGYG